MRLPAAKKAVHYGQFPSNNQSSHELNGKNPVNEFTGCSMAPARNANH
jgi:hypothetical protein